MSKKLTLDEIMSRANTKNSETIKSLNLWGLNLSDISILSELTLLETVSLSKNQIKDISTFKTMNNIKELYLADNQIDDLNQIENLKNCKKLEKLVLKGNPICNNPNYFQKIVEILPNLITLDEKDIKTLKKEKNDVNIKNKTKKINGPSKQIYKNKSLKLSENKKDKRENLAAPDPGSVNAENPKQVKNDEKENGNKNININNNCGIIDPEVGNPKISAKTLEIFNKSFKKKKMEGTFFKLRKRKSKQNLNDMSINENNNALTSSRIEEEDQFKTLPTSFSLRIFSNEMDPNIKRNGYKRKIIGNYKNDNSKLNQSTYIKYKQFDNEEEEEEKRKDNSKDKNLNRSFYLRFNTQTYNKKFGDKKENSFMINNGNNKNNKNENKDNKDNNKIKEINDENNKKIMQSIQLLIGTLSLEGLKEVQNEVQKMLNNMKKKE